MTLLDSQHRGAMTDQSSSASSSTSQPPPLPLPLATTLLAHFDLIEVLSEDATTRCATLLGSLPIEAVADEEREKIREEEKVQGLRSGSDSGAGAGERVRALVFLEKTHFERRFYEGLGRVIDQASTAAAGSSSRDGGELACLAHLKSLGRNDVYNWLLGWRRPPATSATSEGYQEVADDSADFKINVILPASDAHIAKYTSQSKVMVTETASVYTDVVEPWIASQPASRIQWVYNILQGRKEVENVIYLDPHPTDGFVILPDLKWDRRTLRSLYLIAIVQDASLRSVRDLRPTSEEVGKKQVALLKRIQTQAKQVIREKYFSLLPPDQQQQQQQQQKEKGKEIQLRFFIHYHPSYYHLHIHILSADFTSHPGAVVGQAHLLDDVIDLLESSVDFRERTLTYAIGERHELVQKLRLAGVGIQD